MAKSSTPRSQSRRKAAKKPERDGRGRFGPGMSGNPNGRPRKPPEVPRHLAEELAVQLSGKIEVTGADGKKKRISRFQEIAESVVDEITTAPVKDRLGMLEKLDKIGVFTMMLQQAQPPEPEEKLSDLDRALLADAREKYAEAEAKLQDQLANRAAAVQKGSSSRKRERR